MFDYVIIGFGFTKVFSAADNHSAISIALNIANREHLISWLLYNRSSELIYEK